MNTYNTFTARFCAAAAVAAVCFTAACGSEQGTATDAPSQEAAGQAATGFTHPATSADAAERRGRAAAADRRPSGSWRTSASPKFPDMHP
jgi:hypothetical protein